MDADDDTFHRGERLVQERAGLGEGVRHAIRWCLRPVSGSGCWASSGTPGGAIG